MITLERRPFKQFESIAAEGVTRPEAVRGNPTSFERLPTKRDFKRLESVADLPDDNDPLNCTTRYFDSAGNQLWHKNHGATVRDVVLDASGNVYEVGSPSSGITLRKRRAADGQLLWSRTCGDVLNSCAVTSDGGVVVAGESGSGGIVRKYSAAGVLLWTGSTSSPAIKVAVDDLNAVLVLEQVPATPWLSLLYAFAADGTAGETQGFGSTDPQMDTYLTAIAFRPGANGPAYRGTFYNQLLLGFSQHVKIGVGAPYYQCDVETQEGFGSAIGATGDDGLVTAKPGAIHDVCNSRGNNPLAVEMTHWADATTDVLIARNHYSTDISSSTAYYDRVLNSEALFVFGTEDYLFTGTTFFQRFSLRSPMPDITFTGRLWNALPDWTYNHHGTVWGGHALESGVSVMGGAVSTV